MHLISKHKIKDTFVFNLVVVFRNKIRLSIYIYFESVLVLIFSCISQRVPTHIDSQIAIRLFSSLTNSIIKKRLSLLVMFNIAFHYHSHDTLLFFVFELNF